MLNVSVYIKGRLLARYDLDETAVDPEGAITEAKRQLIRDRLVNEASLASLAFEVSPSEPTS